jgi:hypothetical protein
VSVADFCAGNGMALLGVAPTGLPGPKGNLETFLHLGLAGRGAGGSEGAASGAELCEGVEL